MTTEKNITAQELRQDVINRLDASRKAILELSDDELESIAGGVGKDTKPANAGAITRGGSDLDPDYEIRRKGTGGIAPARPSWARYTPALSMSFSGGGDE